MDRRPKRRRDRDREEETPETRPEPRDDPDFDDPADCDATAGDTVELLRRHHEGSRDAAERIFEKHRDHIRRIARKRLGPENPLRQSMDSQDLTQEALLKAYRNLEHLRLEEKGQFLGWIARIIDNAVRDAAAAQRSIKRDARRTVGLGEREAALRDDRPSPSDRAIEGEEAERVLAAFEELPARQREVLVLRREGKTFPEIARAVGAGSEDTVRGQYNRAVETLGRRLRGLA